jgi:hypothetical protein
MEKNDVSLELTSIKKEPFRVWIHLDGENSIGYHFKEKHHALIFKEWARTAKEEDIENFQGIKDDKFLFINTKKRDFKRISLELQNIIKMAIIKGLFNEKEEKEDWD